MIQGAASLRDAAFFVFTVPVVCDVDKKAYTFLDYHTNFHRTVVSREDKEIALDYFQARYDALDELTAKEVFDKYPHMYAVCRVMSVFGPMNPYLLKVAEPLV